MGLAQIDTAAVATKYFPRLSIPGGVVRRYIGRETWTEL